MDNLLKLMNMWPWYAWLSIVGVVAIATTIIVCHILEHRERIEKLRQGIDPDADSEDE